VLAVLLPGQRRIDFVIDMGLVITVANIDGIFSISVLISKVEHLSDGDVLLLAYVADERLAIHAYNEYVDDVGVGDVLELVLPLSEALDVVTQALLCLMLAS
jgi:hypothetical protein